MGAFAWVCDDAAVGWGGGVDDERDAAADLAAVLTALLEVHEEFLGPPLSRRTERMLRRMQRAHLTWLLAPWFLVKLVQSFRFGHMRASMAEQARAERLYGQLSGKDPYVARAEVQRMLEQLSSLDARERWPDDEERPGAPGGADPAELPAAVAALLGYYLAGRQTQDELLREVMAAWADYESLTDEQMQRYLEHGRRGARPEPEAEQRQQAAAGGDEDAVPLVRRAAALDPQALADQLHRDPLRGGLTVVAVRLRLDQH
jgi:hypothetical protein